MNADIPYEELEISPRFRRTLEQRIAVLEANADYDESRISSLESADHIRRQIRLVAAQRTEALRMRLFLDRTRTRCSGSLIWH